MGTDILLFSDSDIKVDGTLKKRNNAKGMSEEDFIKYVKDNNLKASYGYIDLIGDLSNNLRFRTYYKGMVVGVSTIVKKLNEVVEQPPQEELKNIDDKKSREIAGGLHPLPKKVEK